MAERRQRIRPPQRGPNTCGDLGTSDGVGGFTFNPLSVSPGYDTIDIGDLNPDGKMDVVLYNSLNGNASTGISNGADGFTFLHHLVVP